MEHRIGDVVTLPNGIKAEVSEEPDYEYPCMGCCFELGDGECSLPCDSCDLMDEGTIYHHKVYKEVK